MTEGYSIKKTDSPKKTDSGKPLRRITWRGRIGYQSVRLTVLFFFRLLFRIRYRGWRNVPKTGPVLIVANHQSLLDPPAFGCGVSRRMNFLAKQELFEPKLLNRLIRSLDAIPLDQNGLGFHGIKETLKRLRSREAVLIFPEGSRSLDGEMAPFLTGYINIAVKTDATIVPAAIDGAWGVLPPHQKCPKFFKPGIRVEFGEPISPDEYRAMTENQLHEYVETRVNELFNKIRIDRPKTTP